MKLTPEQEKDREKLQNRYNELKKMPERPRGYDQEEISKEIFKIGSQLQHYRQIIRAEYDDITNIDGIEVAYSNRKVIKITIGFNKEIRLKIPILQKNLTDKVIEFAKMIKEKTMNCKLSLRGRLDIDKYGWSIVMAIKNNSNKYLDVAFISYDEFYWLAYANKELGLK